MGPRESEGLGWASVSTKYWFGPARVSLRAMGPYLRDTEK